MERIVTFTKAQLVAILATGVDFLSTWLLIHECNTPKIASSATGTIMGGITSFLMSRHWAFNAQDRKWTIQLRRFAAVWVGNWVLNVSGIALLKHFTGEEDFMLKKMIIAIGVAVFYNYVLQKRYVFK